MFNRRQYKEIARKQLHGRWLTPVLATAVVYAIMCMFYFPQIIMGLRGMAFSARAGTGSYSFHMNGGAFPQFVAPFGMIVFCAEGALCMAYCYLFVVLSHTTQVQPFATFVKGFSLWFKGILGFLWYMLWVSLWSMLFVIPGIIKSISYSMMFFIIAENPEIGVNKAMRMSKVMTQGCKADLFVLLLSFLGWMILSSLLLGLGYLVLMPYMTMTYVNAYHALKERAIRAGLLSEADFLTVK